MFNMEENWWFKLYDNEFYVVIGASGVSHVIPIKFIGFVCVTLYDIVRDGST